MLRLHPTFMTTVSAAQAALFAAVTLLAAAGLEVSRAKAADLVVRYDQAQLLRLPRSVSEIIIGNPSIVDVTIQGGNLLVVTGKTFGITNIIALDSDRNIIQDQRVVVERDEALVNVHRGNTRQTFSCTPYCQPNLTIGDDAEFFSRIGDQNNRKTKFSENGTTQEGGQ
jgi:Flp pilus assembly secretin CpaC